MKRHGPGRALENRRRELRNIPNARDFKIPHAERCDATVHHGTVLHERIAESVDDTAVDLALQRERVEHGPRVMRSRYSLHNDLPRFRIDLDLRHLSGEGGDRWLIFRLEHRQVKNGAGAFLNRLTSDLLEGEALALGAGEATAHRANLVGSAAKLPRRQSGELLAQLARGLIGGVPRGVRRLAASGAGVVGQAIGIFEADLDLFR